MLAAEQEDDDQLYDEDSSRDDDPDWSRSLSKKLSGHKRGVATNKPARKRTANRPHLTKYEKRTKYARYIVPHDGHGLEKVAERSDNNQDKHQGGQQSTLQSAKQQQCMYAIVDGQVHCNKDGCSVVTFEKTSSTVTSGSSYKDEQGGDVGTGEQGVGRDREEQNGRVVVTQEQDGGIGTKEQYGGLGTKEQYGGIGTKEQYSGLGTKEQYGGIGTKEQYGGIGTKEQDGGIGTKEQNGGFSTKEWDGGKDIKQVDAIETEKHCDGVDTENEDNVVKKDQGGAIDIEKKDGAIDTEEKGGAIVTEEQDNAIDMEKDSGMGTKEWGNVIDTEKNGGLGTKEWGNVIDTEKNGGMGTKEWGNVIDTKETDGGLGTKEWGNVIDTKEQGESVDTKEQGDSVESVDTKEHGDSVDTKDQGVGIGTEEQGGGIGTKEQANVDTLERCTNKEEGYQVSTAIEHNSSLSEHTENTSNKPTPQHHCSSEPSYKRESFLSEDQGHEQTEYKEHQSDQLADKIYNSDQGSTMNESTHYVQSCRDSGMLPLPIEIRCTSGQTTPQSSHSASYTKSILTAVQTTAQSHSTSYTKSTPTTVQSTPQSHSTSYTKSTAQITVQNSNKGSVLADDSFTPPTPATSLPLTGMVQSRVENCHIHPVLGGVSAGTIPATSGTVLNTVPNCNITAVLGGLLVTKTPATSLPGMAQKIVENLRSEIVGSRAPVSSTPQASVSYSHMDTTVLPPSVLQKYLNATLSRLDQNAVTSTCNTNTTPAVVESPGNCTTTQQMAQPSLQSGQAFQPRLSPAQILASYIPQPQILPSFNIGRLSAIQSSGMILPTTPQMFRGSGLSAIPCIPQSLSGSRMTAISSTGGLIVPASQPHNWTQQKPVWIGASHHLDVQSIHAPFNPADRAVTQSSNILSQAQSQLGLTLPHPLVASDLNIPQHENGEKSDQGKISCEEVQAGGECDLGDKGASSTDSESTLSCSEDSQLQGIDQSAKPGSHSSSNKDSSDNAAPKPVDVQERVHEKEIGNIDQRESRGIVSADDKVLDQKKGSTEKVCSRSRKVESASSLGTYRFYNKTETRPCKTGDAALEHHRSAKQVNVSGDRQAVAHPLDSNHANIRKPEPEKGLCKAVSAKLKGTLKSRMQQRECGMKSLDDFGECEPTRPDQTISPGLFQSFERPNPTVSQALHNTLRPKPTVSPALAESGADSEKISSQSSCSSSSSTIKKLLENAQILQDWSLQPSTAEECNGVGSGTGKYIYSKSSGYKTKTQRRQLDSVAKQNLKSASRHDEHASQSIILPAGGDLEPRASVSYRGKDNSRSVSPAKVASNYNLRTPPREMPLWMMMPATAFSPPASDQLPKGADKTPPPTHSHFLRSPKSSSPRSGRELTPKIKAVNISPKLTHRPAAATALGKPRRTLSPLPRRSSRIRKSKY